MICEQPLKLYFAYVKMGPFRRYSSSLLTLPIMEEKSCNGKVVAVQLNEKEGKLFRICSKFVQLSLAFITAFINTLGKDRKGDKGRP